MRRAETKAPSTWNRSSATEPSARLLCASQNEKRGLTPFLIFLPLILQFGLQREAALDGVADDECSDGEAGEEADGEERHSDGDVGDP